ncbi:YkgJ family cysteine cluster protein [Parabacteroides goldsteinii]|uniref:YkgJ family cysteine cluster protein n=1 Tax=Parabacteroides goldsteinii TaxID=328812 RepID=UPI00259B14C3|nr:YkgJ family cysteine cluster protein [Parabacteroides goldsteinii]
MISFIVDNWVGVLAGILSIIGAVLAIVHAKKQKGDATMPKETTTQTSDRGSINISAEGGSSVTVTGVIASNGNNDGTDSADKLDEKLESEYESIQLHNVYTSLFAEDNQLKTERIIITQQDRGKIEGYVELNELDGHGHVTRTLTYSLTGVFANKVLTAEYLSKGVRSDERGAINLKLIAPNILSGFCSFSKLSIVEDEIRVSPYVWVEGEDIDLLDGTYDFCTQCYQEKAVCCCASEYVDMPLFLETETAAIRASLSRREKQQRKKAFSKPLPGPFSQASVRQILRDEKTDENGNLETKCHFFDLSSNVCKIYGGRPLDCRLFPFDIKLSTDNSEYIIGYYTDLCSRPLPQDTVMKQYAHILRPYFFYYIHTYISLPQMLHVSD